NKVAFSSWNGKIVDNRNGKAAKAVDVNLPSPGGKFTAMMGWGGLAVKDSKTDILSLTFNYLKEIRKISCGECSVCMIGIDRLLDLMEDMARGKGGKADLSEIRDIVKQVSENSKCSFGQSALFPVLDAVKHYKADFLALINGEKGLEDREYISAVTAPCMDACPAGLDIPGYIELIKNNRFEDSLNLIRENCILPGVTGRVCTHPCEDACVRKDMDDALSIRLLKRAVADFNLEHGASPLNAPKEEKEERIAIIGAGPAGLAAAYNLRLKGYGVTIFESLPHAGGMAVAGIPDYRLPEDILSHEIDLIKRMGVEFRLNTKVETLSMKDLRKEGYSALFISVGAHKGNPMGVEGEEEGYEGFVDGVEFLRDMNLGKKVTPADKVMVVGGGNVALDCARSCARLGFKDVEIIYRRSRTEMPASDEEIEGAEEEGISTRFLSVPVKIIAKDGKVVGAECIKMKLGQPDESGRRRPVPVKGSEFTVKTDMIIAAIGQRSELPLITGEIGTTDWGTIKTDPATLATDMESVFAGGDCVTGPATLIEALDMGNRGARGIDFYLRGQAPAVDVSFDNVDLQKQRGRGYVVTEPAGRVAFLDAKERIGGFDEVEGGFIVADAMKEAQRCLRCYRVVVWEKAE
ncbi:MAG: FAD-dependent oxidoreductase, partial [Thermodesulfobacteriota bacterium]|nr:FAD-dependent oxidoreductase [Thermodesulfobacteriota bacterium]